MAEELFRQSALDKLASPERLDVLMELTPPKGWIALLTLGGLGVGLALWSVFGTIPDRINGQGIMIRGGGLRQVRASGDGTLTKLTITLNDTVKNGQVVGEISQLGTSEEIKAAQQELQRAQNDRDKSRIEDESTIAGIRATIDGYEKEKLSAQTLLQKARTDQALAETNFRNGIITRSTLDQAQRLVIDQQSKLTGFDAQIASQGAQIRSIQQRIRAKEEAVKQAEQNLERIASRSKSLAQIESTVEGHVVELRHRVGDLVRNAEVIATLEAPSADIEPVIYIDSSFGKRVKSGMEAQISPTTVRREEYGFMRGQVQIVGEYPVTADAVKSVTGNDQLVKELLGSGTKIEVHVALQQNAATPSGYAWSSSSGPPFKVEGGTRVGVAVVAAKTSPFNYYVTPYLRRIIGG